MLRLSATAVSTAEEGDGEVVAKLREHLQSDNVSVRVQDECITLCESALRVQEEAVAILPSLLHKEREHAAASRERAADNAERAASLQAELDGRRAAEKKQAHEVSLAQRRAEEGEERLQALQAKQAEGLKSSQRLASELQQAPS